MPLEVNTQLGRGGTGMHGTGAGSAARQIGELQNLRIALLTGAAANTKIALAAIRNTDTVLSALNNNAGTITDVTSTISIDNLTASGTVTVGTMVANDTVTIAGRIFTLSTLPSEDQDYTKVTIGASAAATATNLAAKINQWAACQNNPTVSATVSSNVVTVCAATEGAAGNAITLAETGTTFTVSGATLTGGSDTGGIRSTGATNQLIVFWYKKP